MPLKSMTGFARATGACGHWRFAWEARSVNGKGLDIRLRVPPGFDAVEAPARAKVARRLGRGSCQITLNADRDGAASAPRINLDALRALQSALSSVPLQGLAPASLDGLLAVRGVVETFDDSDDEAARRAVEAAMLKSLSEALEGLVAMRATEGQAMGAVLGQRVETIAALVARAEASPGRTPAAVRERLHRALAALIDGPVALDPDRLHQEAILLAAKADVREELDRLAAHVEAARGLLASAEPVGRRLDFLAQEFAREANTLCAKSNDVELTRIGMDLRVEIEQLREQVQNIE